MIKIYAIAITLICAVLSVIIIKQKYITVTPPQPKVYHSLAKVCPVCPECPEQKECEEKYKRCVTLECTTKEIIIEGKCVKLGKTWKQIKDNIGEK